MANSYLHLRTHAHPPHAHNIYKHTLARASTHTHMYISVVLYYDVNHRIWKGTVFLLTSLPPDTVLTIDWAVNLRRMSSLIRNDVLIVVCMLYGVLEVTMVEQVD